MQPSATLRTAFAALALSLCQPTLAADGASPAKPDLDAVNAQTRAVAQRYFDAYVARDWDRLEPLLADNADFQDSTATLVFGGVRRDGKAAMMALFRQDYVGISKMEFRQTRALQFGHDALFEGELDWAVDMGGGRIVASVMPFVSAIHVVDGKVVHHRDFADYRPFIAADRASRNAAKGG